MRGNNVSHFGGRYEVRPVPGLLGQCQFERSAPTGDSIKNFRENAMFVKYAFAAALGAVVMLPAVALADAASEIATATDHVGYAVAGLNIDAIHMHLHHAVNCLEGSSGKDFDSGNDNPCAKTGKGAIPDTTDAATKSKLQAVVATAETGIASKDAVTAKKAATDAYAALRAIK